MKGFLEFISPFGDSTWDTIFLGFPVGAIILVGGILIYKHFTKKEGK